MANNAPEYSTLMGAQWRITAIREVTGASWRILLRHPGDLTILDRVGNLLDRVKMPDLYRSLQVNFILGLSEIETIKSLQELGLDRNTPPAFNQGVDNLYETPGVRQAFEAQYLKTYMGTFAALPKDREAWPDIYYALKKFDKGVQEDRSLENSLNHALLTNSPLTALLYGATQSGLHVLVQAVAALRIHARTGVYPTTMPVAGSNSVDPLWGKPLTYSLLNDGFSVASKGRDFGKDGPFYTKNGIVFRFPPVRELARRRLTY